jgi:regulator of protease activity HflC (stomatin/prohibitin superfamily)
VKKILLVIMVTFLAACSYVEPGYVGIKVNKLGGDKGVNSQELGVGRYWIGMNEELYTFPTFSQSQMWTKAKTDGSPNDDSFTFQTREGLSVNADLGITYAIDPSKVTVIFQKYRKGIDEITHVYLRNMVRDAIVTEASSRPIESVYGAGKAELIESVQRRVVAETQSIGIIIEKIYLVGDLRLPDVVTDAINAKIGATQKAAQRENEVAQSRAEAEKKIAEAKGEADSKLLVAEAEAKAIKIKGDALSQNPKLVELSAVEKWNGVLPTYMMGNSTPFVNIKQQ